MPVVTVCAGTAIDSRSSLLPATQGTQIAQPVDNAKMENAGKSATKACRSAPRNAISDVASALGARPINSAKCALPAQGALEEEPQCAVPEATFPTPVGKDTGDNNRSGSRPAPHEHPEQSMSLIAPGMEVAANHAALCVPAQAMPGLTRIISSTTDSEAGATEGLEVTSKEAASPLSDEQPEVPSSVARVQTGVSSPGHEKSVGQRPVFSTARSSTAQALREVSISDDDTEAIALAEPSTIEPGEQSGGIPLESQTQPKGYPKHSSPSFAAGPETQVSSVSKLAFINKDGLDRIAPTKTGEKYATDVGSNPKGTSSLGGTKPICGNGDDHVSADLVPAAPGSQPHKVNAQKGSPGQPTDVVAMPPSVSKDVIRSSGRAAVGQRSEVLIPAADSSPATVPPVLDAQVVSAGYPLILEESSLSSISPVPETPADGETRHTEPQSSSQASLGQAHRRVETPNAKGLGQAAPSELSRSGVRAESNTMPEPSQAHIHASNRSMVMRRYGMISPVAGVEAGVASVTSSTGSVLTGTAPGTDAPVGDEVVAASGTAVPFSPSKAAVVPAAAQGTSISHQGRASNELSSSKGRASNTTVPTVEFSASPARQSSGRSPIVEEKNRQHPAEDVETWGRGAAGIGNAKSHANMSTAFQIAPSAEPATAQPTLADWLTEGLARLGSAASQASVHESASPASQAGQLVERVEKAVETLQSHAGKVVRFEVGGPNEERLAVSMQLRDGVLQTVFQTNSQELRDVLARDWTSSVSGSLQGDTALKVAEPVFNGGGRNDFSDTGGDSRHRQQQESTRAQQVPAEASLFGLSRRSAATSVTSVDTPSQAPARHVLSTRGLNAIA